MKALIFDYNGVLADDLEIHVESYDQAFRKYGIVNGGELIRRNIHLSTRDKIKLVLNQNQRQDVDETEVLKEKLRLYNQAVSERDILFPEAREVIPELAKRYKLGIVTSTSGALFDAAYPKELVIYFGTILTLEDFKKPKPDPESLLLASRRLNIKPEHCGYIGDTPEDVEAAHNAGMKAIGITTGFYSREDLRKADVVVANLRELLSI